MKYREQHCPSLYREGDIEFLQLCHLGPCMKLHWLTNFCLCLPWHWEVNLTHISNALKGCVYLQSNSSCTVLVRGYHTQSMPKLIESQIRIHHTIMQRHKLHSGSNYHASQVIMTYTHVTLFVLSCSLTSSLAGLKQAKPHPCCNPIRALQHLIYAQLKGAEDTCLMDSCLVYGSGSCKQYLAIQSVCSNAQLGKRV